MRASQRGISILFVAVVLLLVAAAALVFVALTRTKQEVDRSSETSARLARIQSALELFASTAERLPCPANPGADTGDAEPNAASANCTYPAGTVPWRTIGLRREDSLDAWGWKIGYRVYAGAIGLTQAGGASMVPCDTIEPTPTGRDPATGLCKATHDTTPAQFLSGKGLSVSNFGAPNVTDVAYVVVSFGPSGLGAFTNAGVQKQPGPASAPELANLGATGPFVAKAAVTNVSAEDAAHFDDVLVFRRIADFAQHANLAARDWPETTPPTGAGVIADITFNAATVSGAVGAPVPPGSTGQSTLNFPNATVTGLAGVGTQDISFDSMAGAEGIGGVGGTTALSSTNAEGVRIDLAQKARQLAVTLADFGRIIGSPGAPIEQVEFRLFDGATEIAGSPLVKPGCKPDGDLATFSIVAGADFSRVEIRAVAATNGTTASSFLLAQLLACDAATTCQTSLSTSGNSCP